MSLPAPDDLGQAPGWANYIVAQCVQAMLGSIPRNALAIAVSVDGIDVVLHFQMSGLSDHDHEDISDIESNLEGLVGSKINVAIDTVVLDRRDPNRLTNPRWLYIRHP